MQCLKSSVLAFAATASLSAQAALLTVDGGMMAPVPSNNAFVTGSYNLGGNVSLTEEAHLTFTFLEAEAGYWNTFTAYSSVLGNKVNAKGDSFTVNNVLAGLLDFSFSTNGSWTSPAPGSDAGSVTNGANVVDILGNVHSFATLLNYTYKGVFYDALLVFDDTGPGRLVDGVWNPVDDDNHDDLVIGLNVVAVPAPAAMLLMGLGLIGLGASRRRN
ncbi:MAG: PEP-CTERM sorting domain-containing protein [Gammaproteobacteria bacterium]|nr:PEP-CTERM sorting domain-containing protein [Gammaproteobacteria bacterium]